MGGKEGRREGKRKGNKRKKKGKREKKKEEEAEKEGRKRKEKRPGRSQRDAKCLGAEIQEKPICKDQEERHRGAKYSSG